MRFYPVIHTLLIDRKDYDKDKLREFTGYFRHDGPEESFSSLMLHWFFDNYEKAKSDIELLQKAGIRSIGYIYHLSADPRIPIAYAADILSVVGEEFVAQDEMLKGIVEWHQAGITKEEVEGCRGLWNAKEGAPWYVCEPKSIRAYLKVKADPEKLALLEYICKTYNRVPAEIVADMEKGYSKEVFEAVEKRGLMPAWLPIFSEFPDMAQRYDALGEDEQVVLMVESLRGVLLAKLREEGPEAAVRSVLAE